MATTDQLRRALESADAAGDKEAAQRIAVMIRDQTLAEQPQQGLATPPAQDSGALSSLGGSAIHSGAAMIERGIGGAISSLNPMTHFDYSTIKLDDEYRKNGGVPPFGLSTEEWRTHVAQAKQNIQESESSGITGSALNAARQDEAASAAIQQQSPIAGRVGALVGGLAPYAVLSRFGGAGMAGMAGLAKYSGGEQQKEESLAKGHSFAEAQQAGDVMGTTEAALYALPIGKVLSDKALIESLLSGGIAGGAVEALRKGYESGVLGDNVSLGDALKAVGSGVGYGVAGAGVGHGLHVAGNKIFGDQSAAPEQAPPLTPTEEEARRQGNMVQNGLMTNPEQGSEGPVAPATPDYEITLSEAQKAKDEGRKEDARALKERGETDKFRETADQQLADTKKRADEAPNDATRQTHLAQYDALQQRLDKLKASDEAAARSEAKKKASAEAKAASERDKLQGQHQDEETAARASRMAQMQGVTEGRGTNPDEPTLDAVQEQTDARKLTDEAKALLEEGDTQGAAAVLAKLHNPIRQTPGFGREEGERTTSTTNRGDTIEPDTGEPTPTVEGVVQEPDENKGFGFVNSEVAQKTPETKPVSTAGIEVGKDTSPEARAEIEKATPNTKGIEVQESSPEAAAAREKFLTDGIEVGDHVEEGKEVPLVDNTMEWNPVEKPRPDEKPEKLPNLPTDKTKLEQNIAKNDIGEPAPSAEKETKAFRENVEDTVATETGETPKADVGHDSHLISDNPIEQQQEQDNLASARQNIGKQIERLEKRRDGLKTERGKAAVEKEIRAAQKELSRNTARHEAIEKAKRSAKEDEAAAKARGPIYLTKSTVDKDGVVNNGLSQRDANTIRSIVKKWKEKPEIEVVETSDQIPPHLTTHFRERMGKDSDLKGLVDPDTGKVYLVRSVHKDIGDLEETLFHEVLGHHGLRGTFGKKLWPLLRQVYKFRKGDVDAKFAQYKFELSEEEKKLPERTQKVITDSRRLMATEEVLVDLAQKYPKIAISQQLFSHIRNFFRDLGINIKMSDNDLITKFVLPARKFVETGKRTYPTSETEWDSGSPMYGTKLKKQARWMQAKLKPGETNAKMFLNEDGTPRRMFHGTSVRIKPGVTTKNSSGFTHVGNTEDFKDFKEGDDNKFDLSLGTHLAFDPALTDDFTIIGSEYTSGGAARQNARVLPVITRAKNPLVITEKMIHDARPNRVSGSHRVRDEEIIARHIIEGGLNPSNLARLLNHMFDTKIDATMGKTILDAWDKGQPTPRNQYTRNFPLTKEDLINQAPSTISLKGQTSSEKAVALVKDLITTFRQKTGYDSVVYYNTEEGANAKDPTSVIIFDPKDIKSTMNSGAYREDGGLSYRADEKAPTYSATPKNPPTPKAKDVVDKYSKEVDGHFNILGANLHPQNLLNAFRSVADRYKAMKNLPEAQNLGVAIGEARQLLQRNYGLAQQHMGKGLDHMRKIGEDHPDWDQYQKYMEAYTTRDKAAAVSIYKKASPGLAAAIDETHTILKEYGNLFERLGSNIRGPDGTVKKFKMRDFFFPQTLNQQARDALGNPDLDSAFYNRIIDHMVNVSKVARDRVEAESMLEREAKKRQFGVDGFLSNVERGRSGVLPPFVYDYTPAALSRYIGQASERAAQIEAYGQRLGGGKTKFDLLREKLNSTTDKKEIEYLESVSKMVFGENLSGEEVGDGTAARVAGVANAITAFAQLASPGGALTNLEGGLTMLTAASNPIKVARALHELSTNWHAVAAEGRRTGVNKEDMFNLFSDISRTSDSLVKEADKLGRAQRVASRVASFGLKWSGFNKAEETVRLASMLVGHMELKTGIGADPNSYIGKKFASMCKRENVDIDKLRAENGKGEETDKLIRKYVNLVQGSYDIDQVPRWVNTNKGKFFFKYYKFLTQAARLFVRTKLQPMFDKDLSAAHRVRATADMFGYLVSAGIGGALMDQMKDAIFGYTATETNPKRVLEFLDRGETQKAFDRACSTIYMGMVHSGSLGIFSNIMDFVDQNIVKPSKGQDPTKFVKSPIEPPAVGLARNQLVLAASLWNIFKEKGWDGLMSPMTIGVLNDSAKGSSRVWREASAVGSHFGALGEETKKVSVANQAAKESQRYLQEYLNEKGFVSKSAQRTDPVNQILGMVNLGGDEKATNPSLESRRDIVDALMIGDSNKASKLTAEYLGSATDKKDLSSKESALRGYVERRSPLFVDADDFKANQLRAGFFKWAKQNLPDSEYKTTLEVASRYKRTALNTGLMDVNAGMKPPLPESKAARELEIRNKYGRASE